MFSGTLWCRWIGRASMDSRPVAYPYSGIPLQRHIAGSSLSVKNLPSTSLQAVQTSQGSYRGGSGNRYVLDFPGLIAGFCPPLASFYSPQIAPLR